MSSLTESNSSEIGVIEGQKRRNRRSRKPINGMDIMAEIAKCAEDAMRTLEEQLPKQRKNSSVDSPKSFDMESSDRSPTRVATQVSLIKANDSLLKQVSEVSLADSSKDVRKSRKKRCNTDSYDVSRLPSSVVSPLSTYSTKTPMDHTNSSFAINSSVASKKFTDQRELTQVGFSVAFQGKKNSKKLMHVVVECTDDEPSRVFVNGREARFVD